MFVNVKASMDAVALQAIPSRGWRCIRRWALVAAECTASLADAGAADLAEIRAAWARRTEELRTVEVQWSDDTVYVAGSFAGVSADVSIDCPASRLVLDGNRLRWQTLTTPDLSRAGTATDPHVFVYSPRQPTRLLIEGGEYPRGHLKSRPRHFSDRQNSWLWPLLLWCRGLESELVEYDLSAYTLEPGQVTSEAGETLRLSKVDQRREVVVQSLLELSSDGDYLPLGYQRLANGVLQGEFTTRFSLPGESPRTPVGWRVALCSGDGPVRVQVEARVTKVALNEPVSASEFDLPFPPGTLVRTDAEERDDLEAYIVLDDGKVRNVYKAEVLAGATYSDLRNTPEGMAGRSSAARGSARTRIVLGLNLAAAVIGTAFYVWYRACRKRMPES